jgi:hypothetical protein
MEQKMNFKGEWNATEAILNLYFSDDDTVRKTGTRREKMEITANCALAGDESYSDPTVMKEERIAIHEIARAIRSARPEQTAGAPPPRHALHWLRWAIHSKQRRALCGYVLYCFSIWRDNHPEPGIWEIRYAGAQNLTARGRFRSSKIFGKIHGFTLDEFLLSPTLRIKNEERADLSHLRLVLSRTSRISQANDVDRPKLRPKKYTDKHAMRRDCGTNLLEEVIQRVTEAAKAGQFHLTPNRKSGRYPCKLSRQDLAECLMKKYDVLGQYTSSTVQRAISRIASCPKGNTKKSRPTIKKKH